MAPSEYTKEHAKSIRALEDAFAAEDIAAICRALRNGRAWTNNTQGLRMYQHLELKDDISIEGKLFARRWRPKEGSAAAPDDENESIVALRAIAASASGPELKAATIAYLRTLADTPCTDSMCGHNKTLLVDKSHNTPWKTVLDIGGLAALEVAVDAGLQLHTAAPDDWHSWNFGISQLIDAARGEDAYDVPLLRALFGLATKAWAHAMRGDETTGSELKLAYENNMCRSLINDGADLLARSHYAVETKNDDETLSSRLGRFSGTTRWVHHSYRGHVEAVQAYCEFLRSHAAPPALFADINTRFFHQRIRQGGYTTAQNIVAREPFADYALWIDRPTVSGPEARDIIAAEVRVKSEHYRPGDRRESFTSGSGTPSYQMREIEKLAWLYNQPVFWDDHGDAKDAAAFCEKRSKKRTDDSTVTIRLMSAED